MFSKTAFLSLLSEHQALESGPVSVAAFEHTAMVLLLAYFFFS
jgi:hypothetical protein